MLEPMLRIRLYSAVPWVRSLPGSVAKVMVESGTNMKPSPMPCRMPVRISVHCETSGVKPVISHSTAGGQQQADGQQDARIDAVDDAADDHHGHHGADAARRQDQAGGDHRIAHQVLQVGREQRERGEQDDADHEDEAEPDGEVAVAEDARIDEGLLRP